MWFKASSFCYFISIEPSLRPHIPCWCPESWPSWVWLPALLLHLLQQFISGRSVLLTLLIPQNDGILFCEVRCSQRSLFIWLLFWDRAEMEFLTWNLIILWTDVCYYCFSNTMLKPKFILLGLQTWESVFRLLKMYGCLRLHLNKHKNLHQGQRPDFMTITKNLRQQMNHIKHHFSQAESKCILWLLFISECLVKSKQTEGALRSHPVWGKMLQLRLQQKHQPFVFWGYGKDMGNKDPAMEKIQGRKMNHQLPGNTRSSLNGVKSCAGGARGEGGGGTGRRAGETL